ncbi:MAG: hypothetical protein HC880_15815 [Bacteroidia bacterium]|nr:hypothetical protein [Bacteroidia bacterium]
MFFIHSRALSHNRGDAHTHKQRQEPVAQTLYQDIVHENLGKNRGYNARYDQQEAQDNHKAKIPFIVPESPK